MNKLRASSVISKVGYRMKYFLLMKDLRRFVAKLYFLLQIKEFLFQIKLFFVSGERIPGRGLRKDV